MPVIPPDEPENHTYAAAIVAGAYSEAEMKWVAERLGIDWESIPGDAQPEKALEFIKAIRRRKLMADLWRIVREDRPRIFERKQ